MSAAARPVVRAVAQAMPHAAVHAVVHGTAHEAVCVPWARVGGLRARA